MSARDQRNLLLEYRSWSSSEERDGGVADITLENNPNHGYKFGTLYQREVEGAELFFSSGSGNQSGLISPRQCTSAIRVDDQGQYWIQNDGGGKPTTSFYETFVNSVRVNASESRLLKSGDIISLGAPGTEWDGLGPPPHPICRVKGRTHSTCPQPDVNYLAESPFSNGLILSNIMSYLSVADLKSARLVSKTWKGEASILLEKKGQVSFNFFKPQPTKVARYLKEMEALQMQNIRISLYSSPFKRLDHSHLRRLVQNPLLLSSQEPRDKMMSDLRKLLNSPHNFSSLSFKCWAIGKSAFLPLVLTLQELGEKLVELEFQGSFPPRPKYLPLLKMRMSNLRKFTHKGVMAAKVGEKWVSLFVPLFVQSLEHFHSGAHVAEAYLQEFLKHEMPNLREIEIEREISDTSLSSLLQLRTPLTLLKTRYDYNNRRSDEDWTLLEKLLFKNSSSLNVLHIWISREEGQQNMDVSVNVRFPAFPNLEELKLDYVANPNGMRITWGESGDLYYTKHLPRLRKLSIVNWFRRSRAGYADEVDPVFNSFFPEGGRCSCEVKEVRVLEVKARPRMDRIKETFPNAVLSFVCDAEGGYDSEESSDEEI